MAVNLFDNKLCKILIFFFIFQLLGWSEVIWAKQAKGISFGQAKNILRNKVYPHKGQTFYCDCTYQKKSIKPKSCKILTKKHKKRKTRLEWEHVVPAHAFGKSFEEWREYKKHCPKQKSPRKCAKKKNKLFAQMEGNLFNLVPAVGAVNALRSNYSFTELGKEAEELCLNGLKLKDRKVTPPNNRKGDIARIYLYMEKKYPGRGIISKKNRKMFVLWDQLDPVDKLECELNRKKAIYQGETNQFVEEKCKKGTK